MYVTQALRWAMARVSSHVLEWALPAAALILSKQGQVERAVEIYELACRLLAVANSCLFQDVVGRPIAVAAATPPLEVVAAAQERGRAWDMAATLVELAEELGG